MSEARGAGERIRTAVVARLLGVSRRAVQRMAAQGKLPGATQIGRVFTFDRARIARYLEEEEMRCRQMKISTGAARSGSCEPTPAAASIARAYEHAMANLLGN